jgi:hypothetical protein
MDINIHKTDELVIFKDKYDKFILDKEYSDMDFSDVFLEDFEATAVVANWIDEYIQSLNQTQKDTIICDYGINNAMILLYDSYARYCESNKYYKNDFCEVIMNRKCDKYIIELIFYDKVNFYKDWRD